MHSTSHKLILVVLLCAAIMVSCNRQPTDKGQSFGDSAPETAFAPTPLNNSTNNAYKLRLEWHGNDSDGIIKGYEYRVQGAQNNNTWKFTEEFFADLRLRDGWYDVEVRAVDNAGNADPSPAKLRFHVLGPTFDRGILLMDDELTTGITETLTDAAYDSIMKEAGYADYTSWDYQQRFATARPKFVSNVVEASGQREISLSSFTTIIWFTTPTGNLGLNKSSLQDYLDMGGNLLLAGSGTLESLTGETPTGTDLPTSGLAFRNFHVLRAKTIDMYADRILSAQPNLPHLNTSYKIPRTVITQYLKAPMNQLVPLFDAQPLFVFNTNYFRDSARNIDINNEEFAGLTCAQLYRGPVYNAAIFGFPLVSVVRAGAANVNLVDRKAMTQVMRYLLADVFKE